MTNFLPISRLKRNYCIDVLNLREFWQEGRVNTGTNEPVLGKFLRGRYKIVQVLIIRNFGQTFVAEDTWINGNPLCAVKFFEPQGHHPQRFSICKRRFTSEIAALIKLSTHDQIPKLIDSFEDDQGFYLVRELIMGEALSAELPIGKYQNKLWSEQQCVELLNDVLGILDFVHSQGIIHSDLKPNHLIRRRSDGKLVLIDFGVAHIIHSPRVKPRVIPMQPAIAPVSIPTLGYVPPEHFHGELCPASDLYALGAIAIQALTGLDPLQLDANPITNEINWQEQVEVSNSLASVLNKMVRYNFQDRYQSAVDAREAIARLVIKSEEKQVNAEQLSDKGDSESLSSLQPPIYPLDTAESAVPTDTEELTFCFHQVSQLPQSSFAESWMLGNSSSLFIGENPEDQQVKGSSATKWDYARELAGACLPKLPPLVSGMSAGLTTSNALAISFGLYTLLYTAPANPGLDLLQRAREQYKAGNFEKAIALAKSIPSHSWAYQQSVSAVQQWRQEWNQATAQFKAVEQAFEQGQWRDVLEKARTMPDLPYWQHKIEPFIEQASSQVEVESQELLKQAQQRAAQKDFSGAIAMLKQIPPETPTGAKIQPKLQEYSQKQQIKAEHLLQQAYKQAAKRDFNSALEYLSQIPEDTPTYEIAQAKMVEYSRKQDVQQEVEKQVQIAAKSSKPAIQLSKLPEDSQSSNQSTKASSDLNPGNQLKETTPKLTKPAAPRLVPAWAIP